MAEVTKEDRQKHSVDSKEKKFPITNKAQAISALRLRGHARNKAIRKAIIRRAAKFVPEMAKKVYEEDKKKGLI
jgi:hypothetical protein